MRSGLGYPGRLRILENREGAWATLDFRRSVQVSVPFHATGSYGLSGEAFLLGTGPFWMSASVPTVVGPKSLNVTTKRLPKST